MNERWADGLALSLAAGMREVVRHDPACDGVLIATSDQPLVDHLALRTLLDAFDDDNRVVAAEYEGTIGVPAVIGREHFGAPEALTGDAGAGKWLRSRGVEVRRVPMAGAEMDIDEADDLARLAEMVQ
jgi:CTP:molybdopterin cytidylyltransferase MocA